MSKIATECACRITSNAIREGVDHLVILTSSQDSDAVRRAVGTTMPEGSTSTGSVWVAPDGQRVSVKRYGDVPPDYPHRVTLNICNGGRELSRVEVSNVGRWHEGAPAPLPFVGA